MMIQLEMSPPRSCKELIILKAHLPLYNVPVSSPDLWLLKKCGRIAHGYLMGLSIQLLLLLLFFDRWS